MKLTPLKSSNISGAHYDHDSNTLTIRFHGGTEHSYSDVPAYHYEGLIESPSAGQYFHANIRNTYKSKKHEA